VNYKQFVYKPGKRGALKKFDPAFAVDFDEQEARKILDDNAQLIAERQDLLMAHEQYGLLIIFQAMDGAGKDAMIKNVLASLDPQGSELKMFKEPTKKELRHDYLWRAAQAVPARGQIGVFNRSYYESVVAERVHPEKLEAYNFPKEVIGKDIWKQRYRHINNFEQYLFDNGIHTLKFFLHLSKEHQRERLLERLEREDKRWKFAIEDVQDREHWDDYMKVYEEVFNHTSPPVARWHIIPDDNPHFARAAVAAIIAAKLESLHKNYPELDDEQQKEIAQAKKTLKKQAAKS
jgi:PPK2 family polyphosphate:nucleotide phosphotransferase